jgi:hypothetical protein
VFVPEATAVPSVFKLTVWSSPPSISVIVESAEIALEEFCCVVVPSPSLPLPFDPQAHPEVFDWITRECKFPEAMTRGVTEPVTV